MSESNRQEQPPSNPTVDIFNMQSTSNRASEKSRIDAESSKPKSNRSVRAGFAFKLRPIHFGAAVAIVAAVWIGWPYVFCNSPPEDPFSSSTRMPRSSEALKEANRLPQRYPAASETLAAWDGATVASAQAPVIAAASAPTTASIAISLPATVSTQPSAKEAELQAKVTELQNKLAQTEAQCPKCPVPVSTIAAMANKPKSRPRRAGNAPRQVTGAEIAATGKTVAADSDKTAKAGCFTINTIYRDQAWIQNATSTYVVQAGDVIGGLRIVRVEPAARQVVTNLGVIR